jgi:N-methylhydantoinase A
MARPKVLAEQHSSADGSVAGNRRVYVDGRWQNVATWRRDEVGDSHEIVGPAIVEEDYTAIYVASGWSLALGRDAHLVAARSEEIA